MQNWDDKTQEIVGQCIDFSRAGVREHIWVEENRTTERFRVRQFHNGVQVGPDNFFETREQTMACVRLLIGDYADCYRGIA